MGPSAIRLSQILINSCCLRVKNINRLSSFCTKTSLISSYRSICHNKNLLLKPGCFSQAKVSPAFLQCSRKFCVAILSKDEILEKVMHVCKTFDKIPADKLTLEAHFMNDLGLDSLDHVELIMNIEDDFNFEIPDADAEKLLHVKDIVEYLSQKEILV